MEKSGMGMIKYFATCLGCAVQQAGAALQLTITGSQRFHKSLWINPLSLEQYCCINRVQGPRWLGLRPTPGAPGSLCKRFCSKARTASSCCNLLACRAAILPHCSCMMSILLGLQHGKFFHNILVPKVFIEYWLNKIFWSRISHLHPLK